MKPTHGFLVLDKPEGITSRRAVDRAQKWFPPRTRIGHAGTLDPLATGVLVLAIGQATRLIEYVQRMEKEYRAVIRLGATSDTDDADGVITPRSDFSPPEKERVEYFLHTFEGEIEQVPPAFSAVKTEGRRAHKLARKGHAVDLAPRKVVIHEIQVLAYAFPDLELNIRCGKGTYIRSLARDLGAVLGCGGYIHKLHRSRIGAFSLPGISTTATPQDALEQLLPLESSLAEMGRLKLEEGPLQALCHGAAIPLSSPPQSPESVELAVFDPAQRFRAVARWDAQAGLLRPEKIFSS